MNRIEQSVFVALFLALFVPLYGWFTTIDLPMLVRGLDRFVVPKDEAKRAAALGHEPLAGLVAAGPSATSALIAVARDPDRPKDARIGALLVIERVADPAAIADLAALVGEDGAVGLAAASALVAHGIAALPAITQALADPAREASARALLLVVGRLRPTPPAVEVIARVLRDDARPAVRAAAADALALVPGVDAAQRQAGLLTDPTLRDGVRAALAARAPADLALLARRLIKSADTAERQVAVELARLHDDDAAMAGVLLLGLNDADPGVAIRAAPGYARANGSPTSATRKELIARLEALAALAAGPDALADLASAFELARASELAPRLRSWLAGNDEPRRVLAARVLGAIGDAWQGDALVPLLEPAGSPVALAAADGLARLFGRGRREWPGYHYGGDAVPGDAPAWKAWWDEQRGIHVRAEAVDRGVERSKGLISVSTFESMAEAEGILRQGIADLEAIAYKTRVPQDYKIKQLQELIHATIKMRPVK